MTSLGPVFAATAALAAASPAAAHITLQQAEAPAGSTYRAVLQVGHGCEGAPTTGLTVQIPEGVLDVKPMPKPGWELSTEVAPYAEPATLRGQTLTEGVREITWTGGSLPNEWYDEFVFRAVLPQAAPDAVIRFPVIQDCDGTVVEWNQVPSEGQNAHELEEPAPTVSISGTAGHAH